MKTAALAPGLVVLLIGSSPARAETTPDDVLRLMEKNYAGIKDYSVDAEFSADMDSPKVHISKSKATIYFKRPNKVKVVAKEGFAVMPQTFHGDPVEAIRSEFNASYQGSGKIEGRPVHVLKLVPKTAEGHGSMKLLVDKRRGVILGTDVQAGEMTMSSRWTYMRADKRYWLPSKIEVEMAGQVSGKVYDPKEHKVKPPAPGKGTAVITFRNYRVNKGIPDSVCECE